MDTNYDSNQVDDISSPVDLGAMGLGVDPFTSISPSFFYYLNNHPSDDILT